MAVPTTMTDLSVSEASNSPADSDTITATTRPSDYMRAQAALLRRPFAKGADVASATAANLGSNADGDYFHITGTTGIAASNFGTVSAGIERTIVFDGALVLTHNATSFILPGGANITTAAGDVAVFRSEGSGNWKCTSYVKASGSPVGDYQPLDALLTSLAGQTVATNKVQAYSAADTASLLDFNPTTALAASATTIPSQTVVKTAVDELIANCSTATPDTAADYFVFEDATDSIQKKALLSTIVASFTQATPVTISGTSATFTGIPNTAKQIIVMFSGVSISGTSDILTRLGISSGIETTGYSCASGYANASGSNATSSTTGFPVSTIAAGDSYSGQIILNNLTGNTWCGSGMFANTATGDCLYWSTGAKTLSGVLDRIQITTVNGTDTFDAGTVNIMYL